MIQTLTSQAATTATSMASGRGGTDGVSVSLAKSQSPRVGHDHDHDHMHDHVHGNVNVNVNVNENASDVNSNCNGHDNGSGSGNGSETGVQHVSAFSSLANQAIEKGNYRQALDFYQSALEDYLEGSPTLVELVNAAATCFNLGALSKKLQDYKQAADYFCQAEELYRACADKVNRAPDEERQSACTQTHTHTHTRAHTHTQTYTCDVCLPQLIVETLQARAHLHYKYQRWIDDAIECHELVIEALDEQINPADHDVVYNKIHFTQIPTDIRHHLLVASLQSLAKFYVERGDLDDGLMAYQETLRVLKSQQLNGTPTQQRQDEISQIIKALSDIYIRTNTSNIQAPQLQKLALLYEEMGNLDEAFTLWEQVLFLQSQNFGEQSIPVADTLCQIARVMIMEGNHEGALDLYHAAIAKHLTIGTPVPKNLIAAVAQAYIQLKHTPDAIAWLNDLLEQTDTRDEAASIHYELGKAYLEQGDLIRASQALCQSAEVCESNDEQVFKLLQKVEFLQQRRDTSSASCGLSSIIEDDECSAAANENSIKEEKKTEDEQNVCRPPSRPGMSAEDELSKNSTTIEPTDFPFDTRTPPGDTDDNFTQTTPVVAELSPALVLIDTSGETLPDDSSTQDIPPTFQGTSSASLSPVPDNKEDLKNLVIDTPALDTSSFNNEEEPAARVVTPGALSTISGRLTINMDDVTANTQLENNSKATDVTEQSFESSPCLSARLGETHGDLELDEDRCRQNTVPTSANHTDVNAKVHNQANFQKERIICPCHDKPVVPGLQILDPAMDAPETTTPKVTTPQFSVTTNTNMAPEPKEHDENQTPKVPTLASISSSSPSPAISDSSRTGLLQHQEKPACNPRVLHIPTLSSPKHSKFRDRREYAEISQPPKASSRHRFVKALSSPFRRSKTKRQGSELHALHEETVVKQSIGSRVVHPKVDGGGVPEVEGHVPMSYISLHNKCGDDDEQSLVSQITFRIEEQTPKQTQKDGQWWWGVTAEGLEGWFPTSYVNQAVEAAEGFLSARSIHERVKSRPLDFDSDDESDGGDETSLSNQRKSSHSRTSMDKASLSKPQCVKNQNRKNSIASSGPRPSVSGSVGAIAASQSEGSKHQSLNHQIQEKLDVLNKKTHENGPSDISVGSALFDLAVLYCKQGDDVKAIEHADRALKIQKSTLEISDACKTLHFMADMHSRKNQYHLALSCYSEAQRLQEAVFGYFHEETANTLNRIGNVLARKGEFDMAMENHKEALRILKECCGEEIKNPLVSQTLIQIGAVYYKERNSLATIQSKVDGYTTFIEGGMLEVIGRAHEERGSYRMAIAFFEEKLQFLNDKRHSNDLEQVAETLNSLGMLSCRAGMYLEAIDFYDRALAIQMELGCDDIQLSMARVLAGSVQYALGHFKKAMKLFEDAITTLRQEIGSEQETIAATLFHMGVVRAALCDYDRAMRDLNEAFGMQKKLLGNEHPATLRTRREIANLKVVNVTEIDSALTEYRSILEAQKRIHGGKHPNVAETMHSIGCAYAKTCDYPSALKTLEECYNMRLEFLGSDHPLQATTLHEIAKIQLKRGRVKKALHICESSLSIRIDALSEQHIDVATTMATKASCLVARGSFNEANKIFVESLKIAEVAVGTSHPAVASIHGQIGIMHLRKCHFEDASEEIKKALDIYRRSDLDEDNPVIKEALQDLERVERAEMLCV